MKVLHISNDFTGSKVYSNLISKIDNFGHEQIIYTAIRSIHLYGRNTLEFKVPNSKLIYSHILTNIDRFLFRRKIKRIVADIERRVNLENISLMHAHTWFSDGAVAYELYLKYNQPFLITVRNTDINLFWKYGYHLRGYAIDILTAASSVIFISPSYKRRFEKLHFPKDYGAQLLKKCFVIPSGIDEFWFNHLHVKTSSCDHEMYRFLYVGRFTKDKNISKLIDSINLLNKQGVHCTLSLVGNGHSLAKKMKALANKNDFIKFLGEIYSKEDLLKIYRSHDAFAMPSLHETLGLVYLEAMSQGLPILYSKNEGVDGLFDDSIGVAVNPNRLDCIVSGLKNLIVNKQSFRFNPSEILFNHNWNYISIIYFKLYEKIVNPV